jgi:tetratricopeptide (TPR) repeat protein
MSSASVARRSLVAVLAVALGTRPAALAAQHAGHAAEPAVAADSQPPPDAPDVGRVVFPTSATPAARAEFVRGVALLHSFLYPEAAEAFRRAATLDPGDVMSAAFEALTHTHPVWNEQDTAAARTTLRRLAPTREGRLALARTPRERAWLDAVESLYDGDTPKAVRDTAFSRAMAGLRAADPRDAEAATFYALSLLGLNQGDREPVAYARAEAVADTVLRAHPRHPGALHYKIHAVDDPANAERGLGAAAVYGEVAPDAHHALHMTSHIYIARGMWDDVVAANRRAVAKAPRFSGHYTHWLVYGLLQQGRPREARAWVDSMLAFAREPRPGGQDHAPMIELMFRSAWLMDAEAWDDSLAHVRPDTTRLRGFSTWAEFVVGYAAARRSGRRSDVAPARRGADRALADSMLARMTARHDAASPRLRGDDEVVDGVMIALLRAELLAATGRADSAVALLQPAAARWEALPFAFGPPAVPVPPRERAAQLLLAALRRPADALAQVDSAERMTPGRTQLMLVRARALAALGRRDEARHAYSALDRAWHAAEPTFTGRDEVRAGSRGRPSPRGAAVP